MCGYVGFIDHDQIRDPLFAVRNMSQAINARGPDDFGSWSCDQNKLFLGFKRLAILDLSSLGHQPMVSKSKRFIICFNGEIYNHNEIRKELYKNNLKQDWISDSDTETLLAAIEIYGLKEALQKCVGMFSIALYDSSNKQIYLVRDRFGEKPLYYGKSSKSFIFGSDLSALSKHPKFAKEISLDALKLYTNYSYVPAPLTIYKGFYKVQPGEILKIDQATLSISKDKFWDLKKEYIDAKNNKFDSYDEGLAFVKASLMSAIGRQMISDVPLGAFLSGGIDSSLIVSMMQSQSQRPVKTFTIGFDDKAYDESPHAEKIARHLGTDHTKVILQARDAMDVIPKLSSIYSEPFSDSSQIPTYLVSKIAKESVTVALSGDGGDEIFAGYNRYFWGDRIWNYISWLPFKGRKILGRILLNTPSSFLIQLERLLNLKMREEGIHFLSDKVRKLGTRLENVSNDIDLYNSLCTEWHDNSHLFSNDASKTMHAQININFYESLSQVENMMLNDIDTYLKEDILTKVDRAAMANSLETRAPFLDHTVTKAAWRFPETMLYKNTKGKLPLRSMLKEFIPENLYERPKSGFGIPVGSWIKTDLNDWAEDLLSSQSIEDVGFFDTLEIRKIWVDHKNGISQNTVKLWNILMFISWYRDIKN